MSDKAPARLPGLDHLYPDPPWTRKRRAKLNESPWERAGEVVLSTGLLRVRDHMLDSSHRHALFGLPPGNYVVGRRSCQTTQGPVTTQVRLAEHLGGKRGVWLDAFEVESGGILISKDGPYNGASLNISTVFDEGYYAVHQVLDEAGCIGIELDLLGFHRDELDFCKYAGRTPLRYPSRDETY